MAQTPVWTRRAEKSLERLTPTVRRRIYQAITDYAETGDGDFDKVEGEVHQCRLRVGDWRIVLECLPGEPVFTVMDMGHRREIYRRLKRR